MQGFKDPNIEVLALDVTSDDDVQQVIQHVANTEGRVDVVVNNAATPAIGTQFFIAPRAIILTLEYRSFD